MKVTALISVVVPVYNTKKYLEDCVESLIVQTYKNIEIILVDDGSKDGSGELCDILAEKDNRIRVIHQENQGVSAARNKGINCANGAFLVFVDSDDTACPEYVETLYREISENDLDMVICGYRICYPKRNETVHFDENVIIDDISKAEALITQLYGNRLLNSPCNKIFKRSMIHELFDTSLVMGEDLVFNLNYLKNIKSMKIISSVLYNYMMHENSAVTTYKPNRMDNVVRINKYMFDFCDYMFESSEYREILIHQSLKEIDAVYRHLFRGGNSIEERKMLIKQWCEGENYKEFCNNYAPKNSIFMEVPEKIYSHYNRRTWLERKIVKLIR